MYATMCQESRPVWTAVNLGSVRTDVLRSLDLRHAPPLTARAIRAELAVRRTESRPTR
jgi:hypothetical protein